MVSSERSSQFDKALRGLRSLVMAGEFEARSRLPEVALSERLGISRTPLRKAMDRLADEGLLERIETGGCRVASFTIDDIADAIELRGVLEGTAARLAAERGADRALMARARAAVEAIDRALPRGGKVDFDTYLARNCEFHDLLARLARSPVVEREVRRISGLPLASPSSFLSEQEVIPDFLASLHTAQRQHHDILDAIDAREGARAEALAREHARLALKNLDYLTRTNPSLAFRVPGLALVTVG